MNETLRPYQERGLAEALAVEAGKRVGWVAPTGTGKSVIELAALAALRERGRTAYLTTPSGEIARGMLDRLGACEPATELSESRLWALAEERGIYSPVRLRNRLRKGLRAPDALLVDECFPGKTLVGGRRIDSLSPGDRVPSFGSDGRLIESEVVRVIRRQTGRLVKIRHRFGVLYCTPNHRIRVEGGWREAERLTLDDVVLCFTHELPAEGGERVRSVRQGVAAKLREVLCSVSECQELGAHGADKPEVRFGAHEGPQPDARPGHQGEDAGVGTGERLEPEGTAGRKRSGYDGSRDASCVGARVATGDSPDADETGVGLPVSLQDRRRKFDAQGSDRDRRTLAQQPGEPDARSKEGRLPIRSRVEGISILESGRDDEFERVCSEGAVFDLEVEGTHTYVADGVGVHNCHHSTEAGKVAGELLGLVDGAAWLGWTATPYRGSHKETTALREFWGEPRVLLTIAEAAEAGYLSIPEPTVWPLLDDAGAKVAAGGEYDEEEIERLAREQAATERLVARLLGAGWVADREDGRKWERPTLVAVASVALAHEVAAALSVAGLPAAAVSGETPRPERDALLARCRAGSIALCQVQVLAEGVDLPWLRRLVDLRPLRSPVAWMQLLGRITRPTAPGEPAPEYICGCRNAERHGYLLSGQWPARRVARETQEGFGGGRSGGGPLERGVAKDALRGRAVFSVPLLGGGAAELVHLGRVAGWGREEEVLAVGVPGEESPRVFVREHALRADGTKDWGRWRVGPLEAAGYAGWTRPAPPKPLSEKQSAWWRSAAAAKGLDPEAELTRQQFAVLPALSDARSTLLPASADEARDRATRADGAARPTPGALVAEAGAVLAAVAERPGPAAEPAPEVLAEIERQAAALAEAVRAVEDGTPLPATWASLREGGWGARVGGPAAAAVEPGRALRVRAKSGATSEREVARVVARGADWCLCEVCEAAAPAAPVGLPEGRYAVDDAGTLRFLVVGRRGRLFEQAGPRVFPVDRGRAARLAALVAADPREACARYGRELGICGRCGLALTNAESRGRGMGEICEAKSW